jgi:hypothetical protein
MLAKALGLLLGIALLATALSTALAPPAHADPGSEEAQFLALTNQLRAQHGLSTLATSLPILSIARVWSANMAAAGGISHNMSLPNEVRLAWTKLGENVGVGGSVGDIQQAFINSPHHYENLIDPVWNYVGIGVVDSGGRIWVTVDFMQLNGASAPSAPASAARAVRPPTTSAPRPASAPQAVPVAAPTTPATPEPAPAPEALGPSPALILALEQVRAADH